MSSCSWPFCLTGSWGSGQVARRQDSRDLERKNEAATDSVLLFCKSKTDACCRPVEWSAVSPKESFAEEWCSLKDRDNDGKAQSGLSDINPGGPLEDTSKQVKEQPEDGSAAGPLGALSTLTESDKSKEALDEFPAINGEHKGLDQLPTINKEHGETATASDEIAGGTTKTNVPATPQFDLDFGLIGEAASRYSGGQRPDGKGDTVLGKLAKNTSSNSTPADAAKAPSQPTKGNSRQWPHFPVSAEQLRSCEDRFRKNMSNVIFLVKGNPLQSISVTIALAHYAEAAKKTRGTLGKQNFVDCTVKLAEQHNLQIDLAMFEAIFGALDADGTGRLTRAGWASGVSLFFKSGHGAEGNAGVFQQISKNGDDTLSLQEFEVFLTPIVSMLVPRESLDLRNEVKHRTATIVFDAVNRPLDGRLSADEFEQWCTKGNDLGASALQCLQEMAR
eukprot:gnl/MRDRNA2_/MRDRNA2_113466_c0_seq1.p1 gnl/MRDRNA2_/MRDRNA2_113466_c0~~gnl/MRDRNA2_/MRDRNA2_113466_c0_seq1.p1  ORF type:complete len:447 (+),score=89.51 gnl/MRDRNA2_/MRDRNA2_113466_c0_seq1:61-1401(+)